MGGEDGVLEIPDGVDGPVGFEGGAVGVEEEGVEGVGGAGGFEGEVEDGDAGAVCVGLAEGIGVACGDVVGEAVAVEDDGVGGAEVGRVGWGKAGYGFGVEA